MRVLTKICMAQHQEHWSLQDDSKARRRVSVVEEAFHRPAGGRTKTLLSIRYCTVPCCRSTVPTVWAQGVTKTRVKGRVSEYIIKIKYIINTNTV